MTVKEASAAYMAGIREKVTLGQYRQSNSEIENAFIAGANWAYDTPEWKELKVKPKDGQRILALFKNGTLLPCYYRDDDKQDAILHIGKLELKFGNVEITHWLPLPSNPKEKGQEEAK